MKDGNHDKRVNVGYSLATILDSYKKIIIKQKIKNLHNSYFFFIGEEKQVGFSFLVYIEF